jgi:rhodanese-related sulfurtransferase
VTTYAGFREIGPEWVASHRQEVHVLDVRSPPEVEGELGRLDGAQLIPLDELRGRVAEVPTGKPVVVVCQTGKRSAMATQILSKAGHTQVANVAGGLLRWRELALPS